MLYARNSFNFPNYLLVTDSMSHGEYVLLTVHGGGWMICHFSIVQVQFVFCQLNFIVLLLFLINYYNILFIIIVFRLGSHKLVSCFFYSLSPRVQSRDVTPRLGGGGWFFLFDHLSPFCFLLFEFHYAFSISYKVLTGYVYYYCI